MATPIQSDPVKAALKKAREEVLEEKQKEMVQAFKLKLTQVEDAHIVLRNLERELEELEYELSEL